MTQRPNPVPHLRQADRPELLRQSLIIKDGIEYLNLPLECQPRAQVVFGETKDPLVEVQDIAHGAVSTLVEQKLTERSGAEDRGPELSPCEISLLAIQHTVVNTALHAALWMHDPHGYLPAARKNHFDLDRRVHHVVRVQAIWAPQEIEAALVTIAVKEDRDAGEGRAVLPCGDTSPPPEQVGSSLDISRIAHEVDVSADGLLRREKTLQTVLELPNPDRYRLPTDENDVLVLNHLLDASNDALCLRETQRGGFDLDWDSWLVHVYDAGSLLRTESGRSPN